MKTKVLIGVLVAILFLQLASRLRSDDEPGRLLSGDQLSAVGGGWLSPLIPERCLPVYLGTPSCAACRTLAEEWKGTEKPDGIWVLEADSALVQGFAAEYDIPMTRIVSFERTAGRTLPALGVFATPTSAVLDRDGRFQHVRVGTSIVSKAEVARWCST